MLTIFKRASSCLCFSFLVACSGQNPEPLGTFTDAHENSVRVVPGLFSHDGWGSYSSPDGNLIEGEFSSGHPQGLGSNADEAGNSFSGYWLDGLPRLGLRFRSGKEGAYAGDFTGGQRSGSGVYHATDFRYEGSWLAGQPNGYGSYIYRDGSFYAGALVRGRRAGGGLYVAQNGAQHQGWWQGNLPQGSGESLGERGSWYWGNWRDGLRHGYGSSHNPDGTSYEGHWKSGHRHGFGIETMLDGSRYEGYWEAGFRAGEGKAFFASGSEFHTGLWRSGLPAGLGERVLVDGSRIECAWQGNFCASGSLRLPTGELFTGTLMLPGQQPQARGAASPELIAWLERQTDTGRAEAALLRALAVEWGNIEESGNTETEMAATWLQRAATLGSEMAEYFLALGAPSEVLRQDPQRLRALRRVAAEDPIASEALGLALLSQDPRTARDYLLTASQGGRLIARQRLSWLLATTADSDLRNPQQALLLARPLAHFQPSPEHIDTLAAAYAATQDFASAIAAVRHAITLENQSAPEEAALRSMRARLAAYQRREAWHESP